MGSPRCWVLWTCRPGPAPRGLQSCRENVPCDLTVTKRCQRVGPEQAEGPGPNCLGAWRKLPEPWALGGTPRDQM